MEGAGSKRKNEEEIGQLVVKKQKIESGGELVVQSSSSNALIPAGIPRTSNLEAPIMLLTGHSGEVYSNKFNPEGNVLASASFDKTVCLWEVYGECKNFMQLNGHKNAVLDVEWSHDGCYIYSSSTDKSCIMWDATTGELLKRISGHTKIVNCSSANRTGPHILVTGSDDCKAKLWDVRVKRCLNTFDHPCPVTSVSFSKESDEIFTAGLEDVVKCWDIRKQSVRYSLQGHTDTITGIAVSPDGSKLLSNSMDNSLRIWDINPVPRNESRLLDSFNDIYHDFENLLLRCSWSADGSKISGGSSDKLVYIYSTLTKELLYRLPGHTGSVNEVAFHPKEPIIASCSSDRSIYLGEYSN